MVTPEIKELIKIKSTKYNLDPDLVLAHVMVESSGNSNSTRYEPAFYKTYIKNNISKWKITLKEAKDRATSFGLLQLMGQVAREFGFAGNLSELLIPETGLEWGCRKLSKCYKDYPGDAGIASYNCGTPRLLPNKKFKNQEYVEKIKKYYNQIKQEGKI